MHLPLTTELLLARRLILPAVVALAVALGVAFGAREQLGALLFAGDSAAPLPAPVPFAENGVVPVPNWLSQSDAAGRALPAGGWTDGSVTLAFRTDSDRIGALEPEVELIRVDEAADPVRLFAPRFEVQTGDDVYQAKVSLKGLQPGEYVWRARFVQTVTGRAGEWTTLVDADRSFGIVGEAPRIARASLDGGRVRADKPPLVGRSDDSRFTWQAQATPARALARFAYTIDREETAPSEPPADAAHLEPDVKSLPVGERDDGWWYLHIWAIDQLGRSGAPATTAVSVLRNPAEVYSLVYRTLPTTPPYQALPIRFKLSQAANVNVSIMPKGASSVLRTYDLGRHEGDQVVSVSWDGRDAGGRIVPVGGYSFVVRTVDDAGNSSDARFDGLLISNKAIRVSLGSQSMAAWEGDNVALSTLVTTGGQQLPTPAGNFEILSKESPFNFRSPWPYGSPYWYPPTQVRMAMLFSVEHETFIHDNGARRIFGPGTNGPAAPGSTYGGSHGCVNLPTGAMQQFFSWAEIGTPVIVQ